LMALAGSNSSVSPDRFTTRMVQVIEVAINQAS